VRPVFLSHEGDPISAAQGIHETGFLCPPASPFIFRDRVELLLEPTPFDARDDVAGVVVHGFLLDKVITRYAFF